MVNITALSSYLYEDIHEHLQRDFHLSVSPEADAGLPAAGSSCRSGRLGVRSGSPDGDERRAVGSDGGSVAGVYGRPKVCPASGIDSYCPACTNGDGRTLTPFWAQESTPLTAALDRLVEALPKKFADVATDTAEQRAYEKFMAVNDRCREWELEMQFSWEEEAVGCFKKALDDFFHPGGEPLDLSPTAIFDRGRCGPGASLGANGVDFYTKLFSSDLTASSFEVYYQYAAWCAADPNWRDAEFDRLTTFGLPSITSRSSMTFVPKNRDTMRTICTEPSLNMFAQLGLGAILEDRLRSFFGIDFGSQPDRNAELARLGSIGQAIDTIDLASASDSLSLKMLQQMLPGWVYETLCEYRCDSTRVRGEQVQLHMISTMGNGFTFPLQTIVFSCIVRAAAAMHGARLGRANSDLTTWGVFGDDIACPCFITRTVIRLLEILGFEVNREKSFTDRWMLFRESCGRDYYCGHNVRGVYIKTLQTPQSRYVAINLLNVWSARWGVPLRRTIGYLRDSVRILAVPPWVSDDAGIRVPQRALLSGHFQTFRSSRWRYSYLFRYYEAFVPALRVLEDKIAIPRNLNRVPRRVMNPSGLLIAAIGGYIRGGRIPLALKQGERPCYRMKTGVTPFWGPTVEQVRSQEPGFWERWNSVVSDNLGC